MYLKYSDQGWFFDFYEIPKKYFCFELWPASEPAKNQDRGNFLVSKRNQNLIPFVKVSLISKVIRRHTIPKKLKLILWEKGSFFSAPFFCVSCYCGQVGLYSLIGFLLWNSSVVKSNKEIGKFSLNYEISQADWAWVKKWELRSEKKALSTPSNHCTAHRFELVSSH